jgi:peptide/nickel transport system substrate-binding protein
MASGRTAHLIRVTAALTAVALAVGVGSPALAQDASPAADGSATPAAAPEQVLRVGVVSDLITDNPWAVSAGSDWSVVTVQYDMLLKFADEDLSPAPSLAEGCEPSADYLTWTCTLRDGLTWSDGEPLTSRDVAFTYRFVIDHKIPQYRSYFPFDPAFETPDDRTLIWKAQKPTFAPDLPPWVYIVPEHVWARYDDDDLKTIKSVPNTPSVGSGPFVLTSWTRGRSWTMERNPYYWGARPTLDRIDFRLYTNNEAMVQALRNGEIDFADGIKPSLLDSLEGAPNIQTQQVVSDWWLNLAFNFGGQGDAADPLPALQDIRLRRAIEMAIDKQEIADVVYQGTATPGDTVVRPASAYWHLDIPTDEEIPYDPDAAAAELDGAGYVDTDGDGIREDPATGDPLRLRIPASEDTTGAVEAGQLITGYLKAIGIGVRLEPASDAKMNDFWGTGNFDAYIWYWSGDPDPNYQLSIFTSGQCGGWSDGCWSDPAYDQLYQEQRTIMDRDQRLKVVQEAQRYLYDHLPGVVLAYPGWLQAYRTDRYTGYVPAPGPHGYLLPGYNYDSYVELRPVTQAGATPAPVGPPGWVWASLLAVLAVFLFAWLRHDRWRISMEA